MEKEKMSLQAIQDKRKQRYLNIFFTVSRKEELEQPPPQPPSPDTYTPNPTPA